MSKNEMIRVIVLLLFCIYISREDIKTHCIRNKHLLVALVAGVPLVAVSMEFYVYTSCLIGAIGGFVISFLISWFSKGEIGMGDVKLIAVAGLYLGSQLLGTAVFWALTLIILFGIIQWFRKKVTRKTEYPFAPFFSGGVLITFCLQLIA